MTAGKIFIGTSGWNYKHWSNGVFYPEGLKPARWLDYYSGHFDTVELNYSFYRLPDRKSFEKWRDSVPEGFVFAVKGNRFITHMKRLKEFDRSVPSLLSNASDLQEKLGPILFQFPPSFRLEERAVSTVRCYSDLNPAAAFWTPAYVSGSGSVYIYAAV